MEFLSTIKEQIPDYAKDNRLNLDGVIARSSLAPEDALGVALAAAFAAKSRPLVQAFREAAPPAEANAALTAAAGTMRQFCVAYCAGSSVPARFTSSMSKVRMSTSRS